MAANKRKTWNLAAPGSPPSAPDLYSMAKNKPFILLQTLEPPRGPDYFPMERMRASGAISSPCARDAPPRFGHPGRFNESDGRGGGLARFSRGSRDTGVVNSDGCFRSPGVGNSQGSCDSSAGGGREDVASSSTPKRGITTPGSRRGTCDTGARSPHGRASPAMAPAGDSEITLFGGTIVAKPSSESGARPASVASGEEANRRTELEGSKPPLPEEGGHGDNAPARRNGVGVGIPRFQPLLSARHGEEAAAGHGRDEDNDGRVSVAGVAARSNRFTQASSQGDASEHGIVSSSQLRTPSRSSRQPLSPAPGASTPAAQRRFSSSPDPSTSGTTPGCKRPRTPTGPLLPSTPASPWSAGLDAIGVRGSSSEGTPTISQSLSAADPAISRRNLPEKTGSVFATPSSARPGRSWDSVRKGADVASPGGRDGANDGSNRRMPSRHEVRDDQATAAKAPAAVPASKTRPRSPRAMRARSPKSPCEAPCPGPPIPRPLTLEDFAGADEVCFNPGASAQALAVFLDRCEARGTVALAMLWADLTSSFSAVTVKSCTPSQRCYRWNCACGRQPRAYQATAPIIGAIVYIPADGEGVSTQESSSGSQMASPEDPEFDEGETYLLPLGPCDGDEESAKRYGGYRLPIECQSTYDERWRALAKLLAMPVTKVSFNAQVALMPYSWWIRNLNSTVSPWSREHRVVGHAGSPSQVTGIGTDRTVLESTPGSATNPARSTAKQALVVSMFDPKVGAWMMDTGSSDKSLELEALCLKQRIPRSDKFDGGDGSGGVRSTIVSAVLKAEEDCRRSIGLASKLSRDLERAKMLAACHAVEMPAIPVLAEMEVSGVLFLPERVTRFSQALESQLQKLREAAVKAAGGFEFNLASPEQVSDVLFSRLKLPSPAPKSASGHASTSAEVLEKIVGQHPVVGIILDFRGAHKLKTTYVDKLAEKADYAEAAECVVPGSQDGPRTTRAARICSAWNQTSVRTGRLSCARPNLQQIPKDSDPISGVEGVNIRDAFVASKSFTLMAADYSQIEMRVLADACKDPGLANLFTSLGEARGTGGDVYRRLAAQVFDKKEDGITQSERTRAKVVCLGIVYGMGTPQVARKLGVTEPQAQALVRSFLRTFPRIEPFLATTRRYAREHGYVCTLTGRRRHLPEINNARSAGLKAQAERQAVNSVVQGTAADIIKSAMVLVSARLHDWRSGLEAGQQSPRLIMQIHDELVFECPACAEDLGRLKGLLKQCMEIETPARLGLKCPLAVNMLVGMSWGTMRRVVVPSGDSGGSDSD